VTVRPGLQSTVTNMELAESGKRGLRLVMIGGEVDHQRGIAAFSTKTIGMRSYYGILYTGDVFTEPATVMVGLHALQINIKSMEGL
jgi:hypothetical protein